MTNDLTIVRQGDVRFIDSCDRCGMRLREYYRNTGSIKYPEGRWVLEVHDIPDCIRYLAEKIEALENK